MSNRIDLVKKLSNHKAKITFNKSDGSIREMLCTLMPQFLSVKKNLDEEEKTRKQNNDVLAVWDLEKESWRSFRLDSIIDVEYIKKEI